ncbi:MAG: S-layer homology domain-containing protein [Leptolyngbya sp. BL-A-14]
MFQTPKVRSLSAVATVLATMTSAAPLLTVAPASAQASFSDVQGNWAQSCIVSLTQQGIISGYPDGTFRPSSPVTRAEFASMVGKAFPNVARSRNAVQFVDVASNYWAYSAITTATQTGFLSGYPGNVFNPAQNIPRAQVLVALASGLNYTPSQPAVNTLNASFSDASAIPAYAQSGIAAATEKRLVVNYPNVSTLNPNQLASRAEVSAFLCQALAGTGQTASTIPIQYIAGATAAQGNQTQGNLVLAGTSIPVKYTAAQRIIVSPNETAPVSLTVAQDVRNSQGIVVIPAGSQVIGQLQPAQGGSQFVANQVIVNGRQMTLNASSSVITQTRDVRDPNFGTILGGAAVGSAASAVIQAVTGDKVISGQTTVLGTVLGSAIGANQNRNLGSTIRDAAIGAALGAGVAGITGNRTITPQKVTTGAAAGATLGGILDRQGNSKVVVINPDADLTLTVSSNTTL